MDFLTVDALKESLILDDWMFELEKTNTMVGYPQELLSQDLPGDMNKLIISIHMYLKKVKIGMDKRFLETEFDNLERITVALKQKYSAHGMSPEDTKRLLK